MSSIRFLFDEHVPLAVVEGLRRRGIDVLTAAEANLLGAPDTEYLIRSQAEGRVLVTQDRDLLRLHQAHHQHAGIAYCRQGTRTIGEMVSGLLLIYEVMDASEMVGHVEFL